MGSAFYDWIYWNFFTITINYNISYIELSERRLTNPYEECRTDLYYSRINPILFLPRGPKITHHVEHLNSPMLLCLLSRPCVPLPSKLSSASAAFRPWSPRQPLPSNALFGHNPIVMNFQVSHIKCTWEKALTMNPRVNRLWWRELDRTELNWSAREAAHTLRKLIYDLMNPKPSSTACDPSYTKNYVLLPVAYLKNKLGLRNRHSASVYMRDLCQSPFLFLNKPTDIHKIAVIKLLYLPNFSSLL
jgi:hypothetical protein